MTSWWKSIYFSHMLHPMFSALRHALHTKLQHTRYWVDRLYKGITTHLWPLDNQLASNCVTMQTIEQDQNLGHWQYGTLKCRYLAVISAQSKYCNLSTDRQQISPLLSWHVQFFKTHLIFCNVKASRGPRTHLVNVFPTQFKLNSNFIFFLYIFID